MMRVNRCMALPRCLSIFVWLTRREDLGICLSECSEMYSTNMGLLKMLFALLPRFWLILMIMLFTTLKKELVKYIQRKRPMIFPRKKVGYSKRRLSPMEVSGGLFHLRFLLA